MRIAHFSDLHLLSLETPRTDAPTAAFGDVVIERPESGPAPLPKLYSVVLGIDRYADPKIQPLSFSVADAEAMIAACKAARVKLMIAYRCHYEPTNLKAVQLIRQGALGQVQAIESTFGFNIAPGEWRLNKKLAGGGPLFDVGIYSLNACRYLTGEEPEHILANASVIDHDGRFIEVEENVSWTMKFPSGIVASCNTTYGANMEGFYRVHGSKGWLQVDSAFVYQGLRLRADFAGTQLDELNPARDPSHFQAEAEHFSNCIQIGLEPKSPGEEGLRDMRYITQIYRSAGSRYLDGAITRER